MSEATTEVLHPVTFEPTGVTVLAPEGATLKEAAALAGVHLDAPCGGAGTCGRCEVRATGALQAASDNEAALLSVAARAAGGRLACHARIAGAASVLLGPATLDTLRIIEAAQAGVMSVEPPAARGVTGPGPLLGLVVDIGTTTIVVALVDLESGEQLHSASSLNPQHEFGHDVMARITHATSHGVEPLRAQVVGEIQRLADSVLCSHDVSSHVVREMAVAGNTTMIHLLLGIDAAPLGTAPYAHAFVDSLSIAADDIGLIGFDQAQVYVLPGISAFVGSDIVAGLLSAGLTSCGSPVLFLDLGTNGEMVLRTPRGLVACSTAAGPALEGASISHGMRAESGAIERVTLTGETLTIETIGDAPARGLCGSGLLDLIAVLLQTGVLDHRGRLRPDASHGLGAAVSDREGTRAFEIAPGVYLDQRDVRQVQLANAAISSGISMLLDHAGVSAQSVERLVVAGGFGYHVRAEALVTMGMIPAEWIDRVTFAGNTAKGGAARALLDSAARRRAEKVAGEVSTVDLASHPEFQTRFVRALHFPIQPPHEESA